MLRLFFFFFMVRRPPRSTLFPTRRSSDLGAMNGMLLRTYARLDKLAWDMNARTVDLTVTSARKQDVTLIARQGIRSEEHTSELQSRRDLVCRLLLEKKKTNRHISTRGRIR